MSLTLPKHPPHHHGQFVSEVTPVGNLLDFKDQVDGSVVFDTVCFHVSHQPFVEKGQGKDSGVFHRCSPLNLSCGEHRARQNAPQCTQA